VSILLSKPTLVVVARKGENVSEYLSMDFIIALRHDDTTETVIGMADSICDAIALAKNRADDEDVEVFVAPMSIFGSTAEEYVLGDGTECPYCHSANIVRDHIDLESLVCVMQCTLCGKSWKEIYQLVGIADDTDEYIIKKAGNDEE